MSKVNKDITFGWPAEVSRFQTHGSVLEVSSSHSNGVNSLGSQFGEGSRSTQRVLSLLVPLFLLSSGGSAFMRGISGDT